MGMATILFEQVSAFFYGAIKIKSLYGTRRTCCKAIGFSENNCGTVVFFNEPRSKNARHPLLPLAVKQYGGMAGGELFVFFNEGKRMLGDARIKTAALGVVLVYQLCDLLRIFIVAGDHQPDRILCVGNAAGGIDARTNKKHNVIDTVFGPGGIGFQ